MIKPVCIGCGKHPEQLEEYIVPALEEKISPDQYVREEEGTYNPTNGHFLCTPCYINAGMPANEPGEPNWVAP